MLPNPSSPLNLRPVPPTPDKKHPVPVPKDVKPLPTAAGSPPPKLHFEYMKSKDGFEGNLLIMLHGMGECLSRRDLGCQFWTEAES